jgi:hypothetical protein
VHRQEPPTISTLAVITVSDTRVASGPSTAPAAVAMWASYVVGGLGIAWGFSQSNAAEALEPVALWSVGGLGVLSFVRHSLLHRSDAARMGWTSESRSNFQVEVGFANLAWGLVAVAAVGWDWGVAAQVGVTLVFALYLLLAFVLHVLSITEGSEHRSGAAAWAPAAATLLIGALLVYFAWAAAGDAGLAPFG